MSSAEHLIRHEELHKFCVNLLIAARLPAAKSEFAVETLVAANLRGVDSHGVQLLMYYLEQLDRGDVDPRTDGRVSFGERRVPALRRPERHGADSRVRFAAITRCAWRALPVSAWWSRAIPATSARRRIGGSGSRPRT